MFAIGESGQRGYCLYSLLPFVGPKEETDWEREIALGNISLLYFFSLLCPFESPVRQSKRESLNESWVRG